MLYVVECGICRENCKFVHMWTKDWWQMSWREVVLKITLIKKSVFLSWVLFYMFVMFQSGVVLCSGEVKETSTTWCNLRKSQVHVSRHVISLSASIILMSLTLMMMEVWFGEVGCMIRYGEDEKVICSSLFKKMLL